MRCHEMVDSPPTAPGSRLLHPQPPWPGFCWVPGRHKQPASQQLRLRWLLWQLWSFCQVVKICQAVLPESEMTAWPHYHTQVTHRPHTWKHKHAMDTHCALFPSTLPTSVFGQSFWVCGYLHQSASICINLHLTHLSMHPYPHHTIAKRKGAERSQCNTPRQTWSWSRTLPRLSSPHPVLGLQASTWHRTKESFPPQRESRAQNANATAWTEWRTVLFVLSQSKMTKWYQMILYKCLEKFEKANQSNQSNQSNQQSQRSNGFKWPREMKAFSAFSVPTSLLGLQIATSKFRGSLSSRRACSQENFPDLQILWPACHTCIYIIYDHIRFYILYI